MPCFLVPLHEFNQCHEPSGSSAGGQFCSTGKDVYDAHLIRPGQTFDIVAAANAGDTRAHRLSRRFLFDPESRNVILGVATGTVGREQSHAEAHGLADPRQPGESEIAQAMRYDAYRVHGHVQAPSGGGPMEVVFDRIISNRVTPLGVRRVANETETIDDVYATVKRMVAMGAPKDTRILARGFHNDQWVTFGKAFPELFPKVRKPRLKKAA